MSRKGLPRTAKRALYGNRAFCDPRQRFIRSSKPWERLSIDIVGPKLMTRNKNQYLLTVVDEFSRFPFAFPLRNITSSSVINEFSRFHFAFPLRNITSSSVIKCLSTLFAIFGTPGFVHFDWGTQFVSSEIQKLLPPKLAISKTTPYHPQGNGQNERYNGIVWEAVQCLLNTTNRPLTDWESVLPTALLSIRTLINTVTKKSPQDRFFCFKRGEPLIYPSSSAPWLRADAPVYLWKFVRV